jgi:hypothetical protein
MSVLSCFLLGFERAFRSFDVAQADDYSSYELANKTRCITNSIETLSPAGRRCNLSRGKHPRERAEQKEIGASSQGAPECYLCESHP